MAISLRSLAALTAALSLAGVSAAQTPPPAGTTPGTGARVIDLTSPQPAECLSQPASLDGPWAVVAPYGWLIGLRGAVGTGLSTQLVDLTPTDSWNQIRDGNLKAAAMLHVESGYGPVGVIADLTYMKLQPLNGLVRLDSETTFFELLGMYRLVNSGGPGAVTVDVLAGGRYYDFTNTLAGNFLGVLAVENTGRWIDLVVGARVGFQVTDGLGVFVRGDAGGFGIGHGSKRACNVLAGFDYRCCECASLIGGYRWFSIDRESGVGRDRFAIDATFYGPFAALALRY